MYLEVHIESEEPQVFLIEGAEVVVGSSSENDIVVDVPSVSKKHLKIVQENRRWFAADAGSTNGTYLNTERLIPGQRIEVFANQYLRLGDVVHVALVKSATNTNTAPKPIPKPTLPSPPTRIADEKTKVVSLQELKEAKATPKAIAAKREEEEDKLPRKEKKARAISNKAIITAAVILLVGYFLNKKFTEDTTARETPIPQQTKEMIQKSSNAADKITE